MCNESPLVSFKRFWWWLGRTFHPVLVCYRGRYMLFDVLKQQQQSPQTRQAWRFVECDVFLFCGICVEFLYLRGSLYSAPQREGMRSSRAQWRVAHASCSRRSGGARAADTAIAKNDTMFSCPSTVFCVHWQFTSDSVTFIAAVLRRNGCFQVLILRIL